MSVTNVVMAKYLQLITNVSGLINEKPHRLEASSYKNVTIATHALRVIRLKHQGPQFNKIYYFSSI
ncbi:MAG: hypothetical protein OJF50_004290 [Nitrospira sp.]|nr:hypothetical protein [Nitrospira sp.]